MWNDNTDGISPAYPKPQTQGPGQANPGAGNWQDVLLRGFSAAANVYLLREQAKIGSQTQTANGVTQTPRAVGPAAGSFYPTGSVGGVPTWALIAAGLVVAVVVARKVL